MGPICRWFGMMTTTTSLGRMTFIYYLPSFSLSLSPFYYIATRTVPYNIGIISCAPLDTRYVTRDRYSSNGLIHLLLLLLVLNIYKGRIEEDGKWSDK